MTGRDFQGLADLAAVPVAVPVVDPVADPVVDPVADLVAAPARSSDEPSRREAETAAQR